ncbi:hypothetical protein SDC9_91330 [bioreactor metagenome]|uniref:Uncharacterized protein n=1 Tax=bioreactor metagenome TaxID=1076179 RepID=A0A644ZXI5_9ZZZZ
MCFFVLVLLLLVGSFFYINFRTVKPTWDPSPQNKVVTVEKVWEEIDYSYIPAVQLWGDGKIIWVEDLPEGSRKVFEGKIEPQEITSLLQKTIDLGFFKPNRKSKNYAGTYISVTLMDNSHSEWVDPDDQQLMEIVNSLETGAGSKGSPYVPTNGIIFAFPIEDTDHRNIAKADFLWPSTLFGSSLESISDIKEGVEISGEKLAFAWQVVNSPTAAVESEGKIYWIYLKVNNLTQ